MYAEMVELVDTLSLGSSYNYSTFSQKKKNDIFVFYSVFPKWCVVFNLYHIAAFWWRTWWHI